MRGECVVSLQPSLHNMREYAETVMGEVEDLLDLTQGQRMSGNDMDSLIADWEELSEEEQKEQAGEFITGALDLLDNKQWIVDERKNALCIYVVEDEEKLEGVEWDFTYLSDELLDLFEEKEG